MVTPELPEHGLIKKALITALFFSLFIYHSGGMAKGNSVDEQAFMIVKTAKKYHYAPRAIDNIFSELVFESFLRMLDPHGNLFTKKIYHTLETYKHSLDEQIVKKRTTFLDTVTALYAQQLHIADSLINTIKKKKINFTSKDTLWLGGDNVYGEQGHLSRKWEQWVKYMVLWSYQSRADSSNTAKKITKEEAQEILSDVISRETCRIQLKLSSTQKTRELTGKMYLNAVAAAFDPHTTYFSPAEKKQFETDLSTTTGSFGMRIHLNTIGEVEILEVVPGDPAWNSNKINEGDVILDIEKQNGTKMDLRCTTPSGVYDFLSSIGRENTKFKIRKKDGSIISVSLSKEVIDVEKNTIRSFLLKGERTIGYIYLPSFYTNFSYLNYFSQGCANDLAKELIKLRKDAIDGLILDIRSNSGGSIQEALRTAGAFVDKGALCIIHNRGNKPKTIKDNARGTIYKGPLVILVNSSSASASELIAAVLQDYNRALVVGSTTFGKSTIQSIMPVDMGNFDSLSQYKGKPPGFIKITQGGIYRVSGESHQKVGITPDIELPDLFENMQKREAGYDGSLNLKKISKKTYSYPQEPLPISKLKNLSAARLRRNSAFKYLEKIKPMIPETDSRYPIPLEFNAFKKHSNRFEAWEDSLNARGCSTTVTLPSYWEGENSLTDREKEQNQEIMQSISVDLYVNEATNIINDLIHIKNRDKQ